MTTETTCGCCLEPVDDEAEACDLCSEATGMHDGVGWRIRRCPVHAAAPDLLVACQELLEICRWKCSPSDEVVLSNGKSNHQAMIDAEAILSAAVEARNPGLIP